jgi:O-acetylserine/cysteine efflux transporter
VIFLKERVTAKQGLGLLISFLGIYLLTMTSEVASVENLNALWLLVFVSFLYGMASIQLKFLHSNAATITVWSFFFSFILTAVAAGLWEPWEEITRVFTPTNFGVTALLAMLSMFAFYLWTHLLASNDVNAVVPFIMLVPVSTLAFAYLLLGETTELSAQLGGLVTIVGVGLQTFTPGKKAKPPQA